MPSNRFFKIGSLLLGIQLIVAYLIGHKLPPLTPIPVSWHHSGLVRASILPKYAIFLLWSVNVLMFLVVMFTKFSDKRLYVKNYNAEDKRILWASIGFICIMAGLQFDILLMGFHNNWIASGRLISFLAFVYLGCYGLFITVKSQTKASSSTDGKLPCWKINHRKINHFANKNGFILWIPYSLFLIYDLRSRGMVIFLLTLLGLYLLTIAVYALKLVRNKIDI